ncbi:hypothetical protein, partial [Neisseria sp.]|uniref:hypothetical protein n=1 Tax=Neisseria sp. TaxID=192066 RepID=UPI0026DAD055
VNFSNVSCVMQFLLCHICLVGKLRDTDTGIRLVTGSLQRVECKQASVGLKTQYDYLLNVLLTGRSGIHARHDCYLCRA